MYRFFVVALLLPALAFASSIIETTIEQPYEVVPVEVHLDESVSYLGTLDDYPVMYEITTDEPFTLQAQLWQSTKQELQPLNLLVIRQNDDGSGVSEVTRMVVPLEDWDRYKDSAIGMSFVTSPTISESVDPGTYRIEVSSPSNQGRYMLHVGELEGGELPVSFAEVRQIQSYFGMGLFSLLLSSMVYYPLGIILLLAALYKTWRYRNSLKVQADV